MAAPSRHGAAGNEAYLKGFGPRWTALTMSAFGNLNEMRAAIGQRDRRRSWSEPIQGRVACEIPPEAICAASRTLADEFGLLLVYDEGSPGWGNGHLLAHEWRAFRRLGDRQRRSGRLPDRRLSATERAAVGDGCRTHGSTFGGNPLATAAATPSSTRCSNRGSSNARRVGQAAARALEALVQILSEVFWQLRRSGSGCSDPLSGPAADFVTKLRQNGLLTLDGRRE